MFISYESTELIKEIQEDIKECGPDKMVMVWYKMVESQPIITNYDFIVEDSPIKISELREGEAITKATLGNIYNALVAQNKI